MRSRAAPSATSSSTSCSQAEAGTTYNEPKQIAVQSAIEKAVEALIVEGAELGIWDFADPAAGRAFVAAYRSEKYGNSLTANALYPPHPETQRRDRCRHHRPVRAHACRPARHSADPTQAANQRTSRVVTQPPAQPSHSPRRWCPSEPSRLPSRRRRRIRVTSRLLATCRQRRPRTSQQSDRTTTPSTRSRTPLIGMLFG